MGAHDFRKQISLWISDEMHEGLMDLSERLGLPVVQVIRDAISASLTSAGLDPAEIMSTPVSQRLAKRVHLLEQKLETIWETLRGVGLAEAGDVKTTDS